MTRLIPTLAALMLAAAPAVTRTAAAQTVSQGPEICPGRLTVSGEGETRAVPDRMVARFRVETRAEAPGAALSQASGTMQAVLDALSGAGLGERDVATTSVSLDALRERPERDRAPEIVGWLAGASLRVTLDDPARFGAVADAATAAGATGISDVSLEVADPAPLRVLARDEAVRDALAKAEGMAQAAEMRLGAVLELSEGAGDGGAPRPFARAAAMSAAEMPVAAGEQAVTERVTLVMELCR